jgi:hypothetical protein
MKSFQANNYQTFPSAELPTTILSLANFYRYLKG